MISHPEIQDLLQDRDPQRLEALAKEAAQLTERYFGRTIVLYAPLYLSNYCSSHCAYCGFHRENRIKRNKLNADDMHREMSQVAAQGIENILLLTGESYQATPLSYLLESVTIAKQYFTAIALEVHPMETEEYRQLFENGVDGVTLYQETYDRVRYQAVHLNGKKSDYDYRYRTPERIARAGMRQISMGILLGLGDPADDLFNLFEHLRWMERHFPGVEYSLSFPRLRPAHGIDFPHVEVADATLIKIICLARISFPRVGINLSTREIPWLRDHALGLGITRISAGSNTSVGGYSIHPPEGQDPQFEVEDKRSVNEIVQMLKLQHFDPVFTDWRPITNR
jgi:2-iminoacetate synthase